MHTRAHAHIQCWPEEKQAKDITPEASENLEERGKAKSKSFKLGTNVKYINQSLYKLQFRQWYIQQKTNSIIN